MAAATLFLANSDGCTALLHYDDVTLIASTITMDAQQNGPELVTFWFKILNVSIEVATASRGISTTLTFTPITLIQGAKGLQIPNFARMGIGVNIDVPSLGT